MPMQIITRVSCKYQYSAHQFLFSKYFTLLLVLFSLVVNLNGCLALECDTIACLQKANNKVRQISGYIVYAAECRKDIQAEYPGQTFGDISRIVGNKVGLC